MFKMLYIIFIIALAVYLFYRWYISNFDYFKRRGLDGPKPSFPFGNIPNAFTQKKHSLYDLDDIYQ